MSLPLVSSIKLVNALERAGFRRVHVKGGHATYSRERDGGRCDTVTIVLGKREVPRGTLRSVLRQAGMTEEELRTFLR
jgi:predicted RNA binding protein YcfA (HicA-like mRNA interferase family)